ncbi:hypothetical protein A1O3_02553 [Capronia epimyces CBS 606.96]|uniref:SigF-like NTF2-like domain-containing protein n=1 Tax=Capronia epimyces CBS 606.96 TaxID=1182542 RepID=W9YJS0_9EURO|nr:uncharacterized protein A1O3_02553 [Capronia epimyces CBS 606.96]EXJ89486.1 hypothetical protein A1O3_02553 [Capronia epimyces CBS 606.96]
MDDPVAEIPRIIRTLCTASPAIQRSTIDTYFTPTASFTHPFCRTGSFAGSIWLIMMIYRWYKILSPHIDICVDSVAFDKENLLLYVSMHQNFKLWVVPFYNAPVKLVTVLQLTTDPFPHASDPLETVEKAVSLEQEDSEVKGSGRNRKVTFSPQDPARKKDTKREKSADSAILKQAGGEQYFIQSQNDLYQTSEWIKFLIPWGLGVFLVVTWQVGATIACVIGTKLFDLFTWLPRKLHRGHYQGLDNDTEVLGAERY